VGEQVTEPTLAYLRAYATTYARYPAGCIAEQAAEAQEAVARRGLLRMLGGDTPPQQVERQTTD
jgi:hypothetical protein